MAYPDHGRYGFWSLALLVPLIVVLAGVQAGTSDRLARETGEAIWQPNRPVGIAVRNGRATFSIPFAAPGSEAVVIVSALTRAPGPFPIHMQARKVETLTPAELVDAPPLQIRRLPVLNPEPIKECTSSFPARVRGFHVMVRDGDVSRASNYLAVRGMLEAVGKRIQVYVDSEDVDKVDRGMLIDLVTTFDDHIFPATTRTIGQAFDIDNDGRFTVLLSNWLSRLGNGKNAVDGFVRVTDLDPSYSPPFGNRCDMMYLSAGLKPGTHMRTVLAHEYMHAVAFSQKTLRNAGAIGTPIEEEGWLDEAIAHLAEDLHGFSRSNINYRVSAFLSQPERYQLVVEDYFAADLFRSHGHRGATYLFLRWCVDQYGPDLLPVLIRSRQRGIANLEEATGCSFAELYRRWSVALIRSGVEASPEGMTKTSGGYHSIDIRAPMDGWQLAGPRTTRLVAGGPLQHWNAMGTSSHFVEVRSRHAGAVELDVSGPPDAELQVTAFVLPANLASLDLDVRTLAGPEGQRWM